MGRGGGDVGYHRTPLRIQEGFQTSNLSVWGFYSPAGCPKQQTATFPPMVARPQISPMDVYRMNANI